MSRASIDSENSWAISVSVSRISIFIELILWRASESHDLHAGIDEQDVAGDAAPQIAGQEDGGIGDLGRIGVAAQRSARRPPRPEWSKNP